MRFNRNVAPPVEVIELSDSSDDEVASYRHAASKDGLWHGQAVLDDPISPGMLG